MACERIVKIRSYRIHSLSKLFGWKESFYHGTDLTIRQGLKSHRQLELRKRVGASLHLEALFYRGKSRQWCHIGNHLAIVLIMHCDLTSFKSGQFGSLTFILVEIPDGFSISGNYLTRS